MFDDSLLLVNPGKNFASSVKLSKPLMSIDFKLDGYNEDLVEIYNWHLNFPYYTGKGFTPLKLEDYHYFSENSQMGAQYRQIKGGSIRAFQENLNQMIVLIKQHLMPLLKEVKEAHFYKKWFDTIVKTDKEIREELKKSSPNNEKIEKLKRERDEAIRVLKDKWVTEVDKGRLWQISKSAAEGGLDFNLVPTLFLGTNIDNPLYLYHKEGKSLQEQMDELLLPVETTTTTKNQVANFLFRFYTWLPTAIKDTYVTYRLKVNALKQFYTQLQMQINFMKPLLIEIKRKMEGFEKDNIYRGFETENPEFVNLFDFSYSFVRILGVRNFAKINRGKWEISDLEFTRFGIYLRTGSEIIFGPMKGKTGFLRREVDGKYEFFPCNNKNISKKEFDNIKPVLIEKTDLKKFPILEYEFSQRRRVEVKKSQQGLAQVPYMINRIKYHAKAWNIFEVAAYREKLKEDNLDLIETFVEEIRIIKDDLLFYANDLEEREDLIDRYSNSLNNSDKKNNTEKDKKSSSSEELSVGDILFAPFIGFFELFGVNLKIGKFPSDYENREKVRKISNEVKRTHTIVKLQCVEDTWKVYNVFKKSHGIINY
jgi:hypothetical protein